MEVSVELRNNFIDRIVRGLFPEEHRIVSCNSKPVPILTVFEAFAEERVSKRKHLNYKTILALSERSKQQRAIKSAQAAILKRCMKTPVISQQWQ